MQVKHELNIWYETKDPWRYKENEFDLKRRRIICMRCRGSDVNEMIGYNGGHDTILDIGCGEGFITCQLPGKEVFGYDISDIAMSRLPDGIIPVSKTWLDAAANYKFDMVVSTDTLYKEYNWRWIVDAINKFAGKFALTCNIESKELPGAVNAILGKQIHEERFPYRFIGDDQTKTQMIQVLRIFDFRRGR